MPKQILRSVGRGGVNFPPDDVMTVQYLLNCVPVQHGGPAIELDIDGAIGPKTIAAIERFQAQRFSFVDGRVDPNGQTLGALLPFDPAPQQPLPPPGGSDVKNAGTAQAAGKSGSTSGGTGGKSGAASGKTGAGGSSTGFSGKTGSRGPSGFGSKGF